MSSKKTWALNWRNDLRTGDEAAWDILRITMAAIDGSEMVETIDEDEDATTEYVATVEKITLIEHRDINGRLACPTELRVAGVLIGQTWDLTDWAIGHYVENGCNFEYPLTMK